MFDKDRGRGGRSPATSDNRESYDDRLGHILGAATDVIARVGYEKASMRMVAATAGVSLAGIYHYFEAKERMLFLIQFRAFTALLNTVREKLHGVEDPVEQLRVMVRNHVAYFVANMAALKACSHELDSLSGAAFDEIRQIRRDYYGLTRGIVERILAQHAPGANVDHHVTTMCLFGALNWMYRWYEPKRGRSPVALANQITDQYLHGLLGRSPSRTEMNAAST